MHPQEPPTLIGIASERVLGHKDVLADLLSGNGTGVQVSRLVAWLERVCISLPFVPPFHFYFWAMQVASFTKAYDLSMFKPPEH